MPVGRIEGGDMSGNRRNAPGKLGPLSLAEAALRVAAKAGMGKSGAKAAKQKSDAQNDAYAKAMRSIKGEKKAADPKRVNQAVAKTRQGSGPVIEGGNINLSKRPQVKNKDGSTSTVRSMSFQNNKGEEVLIPTVVGKKVLTDKKAMEHYGKTGQHLGKFKTAKAATKYAERVHKDQAKTLKKPKRVASR